MVYNSFHIQKKVKQSDIQAFEILFKENYSLLCHFAFRIVKDMDVAEEIVQDFFYNYWKNRESIKIRISARSYFFSSIRNLSLNYIKHQQIRKKYFDFVVENNHKEAEISQIDQLQAKEMQRIMDEALSKLPERCQQIFRLSRLEGKKYNEIAEIFDISVKTVEANISKALQTLRESLEKYHKEPVRRN